MHFISASSWILDDLIYNVFFVDLVHSVGLLGAGTFDVFFEVAGAFILRFHLILNIIY